MKKVLLIVVLFIITGFSAAGAEVGGRIDVNYHMWTPSEEYFNDPTDYNIKEAYFASGDSGDSYVWVKHTIGENLIGLVMLSVDEDWRKLSVNDEDRGGVNSLGFYLVEELWITKSKLFGKEALSVTLGKMEVPFNLNIDKSITGSFTDGVALSTSGLGAFPRTWGCTISFKLGKEKKGVVNLTTFEGMSGISIADEADEDSGLFTSLAVNWDSGDDAFGAKGLRLVIGYAKLAQDEDADDGNITSIGVSYTLGKIPLSFGLEIDMGRNIVNGGDGTMLTAIDIDFKLKTKYSVGLSFETLNYKNNNTLGSDKRTSVRGSMDLLEDGTSKARFEYAKLSNTEDGTVGGSLISLGLLFEF